MNRKKRDLAKVLFAFFLLAMMSVWNLLHAQSKTFKTTLVGHETLKLNYENESLVSITPILKGVDQDTVKIADLTWEELIGRTRMLYSKYRDNQFCVTEFGLVSVESLLSEDVEMSFSFFALDKTEGQDITLESLFADVYGSWKIDSGVVTTELMQLTTQNEYGVNGYFVRGNTGMRHSDEYRIFPAHEEQLNTINDLSELELQARIKVLMSNGFIMEAHEALFSSGLVVLSNIEWYLDLIDETEGKRMRNRGKMRGDDWLSYEVIHR